MSYAKLFKACQDFALGIGYVNQAAANLVQQRTNLFVEHGSGVFRNPYAKLGAHNTPLIPRATVRVKPGGLGGSTLNTYFDQPTDIMLSVAHQAAGTWVISFAPELLLFFGQPRAAQTSNLVTRLCSGWSATIGGPQSALNVKTYDLQTGDFVLTDYEWSVVIYSYA